MSSFWKSRNPPTKQRRLKRAAPTARPFGSKLRPDGSTIRHWITADETAKTMLERIQERFLPTIKLMPPLHRMALHGRHVLEIAGASGSGKSELLFQDEEVMLVHLLTSLFPAMKKSVVTCLLPIEWGGLSLGGSEKPVVYYDLDGRFDIRRLAHLLECRIYNAKWDAQSTGDGLNGFHPDFAAQQRLLDLTPNLIKCLVRACLSRFYLKRCHSSFEILAIMKTTRYHFKQIGLLHGSYPELLVIDSITAFYWTERITRTQYGEGGRRTLSLQTVSGAIVNELRQLVSLYPKLLIMATKTMILKNWKKSNCNTRRGWYKKSIARTNRPGFRPLPEEIFKSEGCSDSSVQAKRVSTHVDFVPAHWRGFVTHRILLQGPYLSELAPTSIVSPLSPAFFTAEWNKPSSRGVHFFTVQIDGIQEVPLNA